MLPEPKRALMLASSDLLVSFWGFWIIAMRSTLRVLGFRTNLKHLWLMREFLEVGSEQMIYENIHLSIKLASTPIVLHRARSFPGDVDTVQSRNHVQGHVDPG